MKQDKVLLVIVLYKEQLFSTLTWKTLLADYSQSDRVSLYVHDNSPSPQNVSTPWCVCYHHDARNGGLSAAYNQAARFARVQGYDWMLLLDQDTTFPAGALDAYLQALDRQDVKAQVFVPQLVYQKARNPFSPVRISSCMHAQGVFLDNGFHAWGNYSMVNSGLCVQTASFHAAGGYNEKVRLDFADFQFVERLRKVTSGFVRIDIVAEQAFSNEQRNVEDLLSRYRLYVESAYHCEKTSLKKRLGFFYVVLRHTLALTVRTKSLSFLHVFSKEYCLRKNIK